MKIIYLVTVVLLSLASYSVLAKSHRKCVVLPMSKLDKESQEFHSSMVKYFQGTDWCVSKSTNELMEILNNYKKDIDSFISNKKFRIKVADRTGANSLIFFRVKKNKYYLEIWDESGLLLRSKLDGSYLIDEAIKVFNMYKDSLPYEATVVSSSTEQIVIDGGRRFGFDIGDRVKFYKNGKSLFHPRNNAFLNFYSEQSCSGSVVMSNFRSSYIVLDKKCKEAVRIGSWVKLIDIVKPSFLKEKKDQNKKFLDISTGFGISLFDISITDSSIDKFSGPKFGFNLDADLLLTRNIVAGMSLGGSFSILSASEGEPTADLLNTFGNNWATYVSYRYWLENFSKDSFIDFSVGYSSNYFGFNSSSEDLISGHKYYGLSLRGNLTINIFDIKLFSKINFLPSGNFSQNIEYINNVDSVSAYDIEIGAYYDIYNFQNIFSVLKISKYKASSSSNSIESTIQDIGLLVGYKFRI
jgi:hypothetical protein